MILLVRLQAKNATQAIYKALHDADIRENPDYFRTGDLGCEPAKILALELLRLPQRPTAIFAMSDVQALGCLSAARELGLRVPEDVSIIGYDDLEMSEHIGLTTYGNISN